MNKLIIFTSAIVMSTFVSTSGHAADKYYGKFPTFGWQTITCVVAKGYYDNMDKYEQGYINMLEDRAAKNGWSDKKLARRIDKAEDSYEDLKEDMWVKVGSLEDDNNGRCDDKLTN